MIISEFAQRAAETRATDVCRAFSRDECVFAIVRSEGGILGWRFPELTLITHK